MSSARPTAQPPPLGVRIGLMLVSLLVTAGLCEGMVRWQSGGALPYPNLFAVSADGTIGLQASKSALLRRPDGQTYTLRTGGRGLRVAESGEPPGSGGWLVVGDSQVLGQGVDQERTFTGLLTARGVIAHNAGVPGYGVEDSLGRAQALLPSVQPDGVLIVVNQLNDWEDLGQAVTDRYQVRGGFLLRRADAETARGTFLDSPLARSHLAFYAGWSLLGGLEAVGEAHSQEAPSWVTHPESEEPRTQDIAAALSSFAQAHSNLPVVVAYLPADFATGRQRASQSPFAHYTDAGSRPAYEDASLRDQLIGALPWTSTVDLLAVLRDQPDAFQPFDYHLSALGHGLVADAIEPVLRGEP